VRVVPLFVRVLISLEELKPENDDAAKIHAAHRCGKKNGRILMRGKMGKLCAGAVGLAAS
jgi:hypothetical protein